MQIKLIVNVNEHEDNNAQLCIIRFIYATIVRLVFHHMVRKTPMTIEYRMPW